MGYSRRNFTAAGAIVTSLIIAVIAIPVAWASSYLTAPVVREPEVAPAEFIPESLEPAGT